MKLFLNSSGLNKVYIQKMPNTGFMQKVNCLSWIFFVAIITLPAVQRHDISVLWVFGAKDRF